MYYLFIREGYDTDSSEDSYVEEVHKRIKGSPGNWNVLMLPPK